MALKVSESVSDPRAKSQPDLSVHRIYPLEKAHNVLPVVSISKEGISIDLPEPGTVCTCAFGVLGPDDKDPVLLLSFSMK